MADPPREPSTGPSPPPPPPPRPDERVQATGPVAAPPASLPTHRLATVGIALGVSGLVVPVLPPAVGAGVSAIALRRIAAEPERWGGRGVALTGVVVGSLLGLAPAWLIAALIADDVGMVPGVIVALYSMWVLVTATRGMSTGRRTAFGVATLGGGLAMTVVAALITVALAWGFVALFTEVTDQVVSDIGDAFSDAFSWDISCSSTS